MSDGTFHNWKAKFGGMTVSDAKRLKTLEDENARLKKLLAEQMLDGETISAIGPRTMVERDEGTAFKKMVGPAVKRAAVAHLRARMGLSERRACRIVGADRKRIRYRSIRPPETELRRRLRDLANEPRRFGYRRLFILLRREGEPSGINRIYRLYREEGLAVRKRRARRKAVGTRAPILVEARPSARPFRQICVANLPKGGTEPTSNAILTFAAERGVEWHYIAPGKPMQNGFVESYNGRMRPSRQIASQSPAGQWTSFRTRQCSATWPMHDPRSGPGRQTTTKRGPIWPSAIRPQRRSPRTCSPQPTAALRHLKAPRNCRLLHLRQSAYQTKGLRSRLDESSVAGQSHCS